MDASIVASLATSLSSASTLAKALLGMKVDQEVISKVSALQAEIMTAQSAALSSLSDRAALVEKVDSLEQKLKAVEGWEAESRRYRLTEFSTGVQAYVLRTEAAVDEPIHRLCPNCFQNQRKSIMQTIARIRGGEIVDCPSCKLRLELTESAPRPPVSNDSGFY